MKKLFICLLALSLFPLYSADKVKYPASAFDQSTLNFEDTSDHDNKVKIVLIPGTEKKSKPSGNHEYMAGCALLQKMLNKLDNVHTVLSNYDWPKNETILDDADVIVIYSNGDGKQGFMKDKKRQSKINQLINKGVGFVNLHASICYLEGDVDFGIKLIGGVWVKTFSLGNRGHWKSTHNIFPNHPVTSGVTPWKADDGWCHKILIPEENRNKITPLLWSSKTHKGDPKGGDADIVAWTFDRKDGGRSFSCSGAHGHWEWANDGLRQLIVNGILWTAKMKIPDGGFNCQIDKENMNLHFDDRKK